jgi:hypothetical protein
MNKDDKLKADIEQLKKQKSEVDKKLTGLLNTCEHRFVSGYTMEPVVYCEICDREATDIFPNMAFKHIEKLVN